MIIPIETKEEAIECPYCSAALPRTLFERDLTFKDCLVFVVVAFFVIQIFCVFGGIFSARHYNCDIWPDKKYDLLAPGFAVGCLVGDYLKEDL